MYQSAQYHNFAWPKIFKETKPRIFHDTQNCTLYAWIFSCHFCNDKADGFFTPTLIACFTEDEPPKTMMATEGGDDNLPPQVSAS